MLKKKRKKKKIIIQKLSRFYSLDELDDYYSVVFQKLLSLRYAVSESFFFYLLRLHEKRYKIDYKNLKRTERREFRVNKRLYVKNQQSGKIKPYSFEKQEKNNDEFFIQFLDFLKKNNLAKTTLPPADLVVES